MAARTCAVGAPSRAATDRIRWRNAADGHQQLQWADLHDGLGRGTSLRGNNPGMRSRLVFLVPGFFGFTSIGAISYFERVEQTLRRALRRHGTASKHASIAAALSPRRRSRSAWMHCADR